MRFTFGTVFSVVLLAAAVSYYMKATLIQEANNDMRIANQAVKNRSVANPAFMTPCDTLKSCKAVDHNVAELIQLVKAKEVGLNRLRAPVPDSIEEFLCQADYGQPPKGMTCLEIRSEADAQ